MDTSIKVVLCEQGKEGVGAQSCETQGPTFSTVANILLDQSEALIVSRNVIPVPVPSTLFLISALVPGCVSTFTSIILLESGRVAFFSLSLFFLVCLNGIAVSYLMFASSAVLSGHPSCVSSDVCRSINNVEHERDNVHCRL